MELQGKIITINNIRFRIIYIGLYSVSLCELDTSKLIIKCLDKKVFDKLINEKIIEVSEDENIKVFDINKLNEKKKAHFYKAKNIICDINEAYGPTYIGLDIKRRNGSIDSLIQKSGTSRNSFWRYVRNYLQSGLQDYALISKRGVYKSNNYNYRKKVGRRAKNNQEIGIIVDDYVKSIFDKGIKEYLSGRQVSMKKAYQVIINDYYSTYDEAERKMIWLPINQRPTFRQFYNYLRKEVDQVKLAAVKTSKREILNDRRLLLSSSRTNSIRPGNIVEIDALEVDVSLVSTLDPEQTIGRPILYCMVDVLTSTIIAVSVSLENNSMIGLTNLFINLSEDKVSLCAKNDITIKKENWPSNILPREVRVDRGSDFASNAFMEICHLNGIRRTLEPPGAGSMKGIVEQSFHQFHETIRPEIEGFGLITKRHDSKHHRQAMLNINQFIKIVYQYVIYHNEKQIIDYPKSKEMIDEGLNDFSPISLWKYFGDRRGYSIPISESNLAQYLFNLFKPVKATLCRKGIVYRGLYYLSNDSELYNKMFVIENRREKMQIKIDPRDVENIYYINDQGNIITAFLNPNIPGNDSFKGLSWKNYLEYHEKIKETKRNSFDSNQELMARLRNDYQTVINEAMSNHLSTVANLSKARKEEKEVLNVQSAVGNLSDTQQMTEKEDENEEEFDDLYQTFFRSLP